MIGVAGYCRVSTDKDDQANSFEAQQHYFREYIARNPEWELYRIYADEGISGTSTKKRTEFNRMIADAYDGRFKLILTKEVSRFSRNILDTIAYTRALKRRQVAVEFLTDNINTLDADAELRLSIMATLAQDESRRTSGRVTWGQTRQMEKGVVFGRSLLGYDVTDGRLVIEPEGAELVRLIFRKYAAEQVSTSALACYLMEKGYRTSRGNERWTAGAIVRILRNEKYVGDLVQKKTYTPDYLTHEKRRNRGEVPQIRMENHHEPIIDRELWALTQRRLEDNNKHNGGNSGHSNRYVFSGKIRCGECGAVFVGRIRSLQNGTSVRRWSCSSSVQRGRSGCSVGRLVRDADAMQMLKAAIQSLPLDTQGIIERTASLALEAICGEKGSRDGAGRLGSELDSLRRKKENMLDNYFSGCITNEDMQAMKRRYEQREHILLDKLKQFQDGQSDVHQMREALQRELAGILMCETDSEVFCKVMLDSLTVFKDRHLELRLHHLPHVFRFEEVTSPQRA